jgi:hypothetical protein
MEVVVGTLEIRYPAYKFQVKTEGETCKSHALRVVNLGVNHMAQVSSGAATCPAASAPAARPGAAPGPPRVPWRPNGRRAIKVTDIP